MPQRRQTVAATPLVTPRPRTASLPAGWHRLLVPGLLSAALLGGLALRLWELGRRSLWVDELFSVGLAAQSPPTILTVLYGEEANMTLYYIVMFLWVRIVGAEASELWMRLPSVLFGVAGIWALYRLATRLDRPATGVLAAGLAAINAYHVEMSQEARAYTLWALVITMSWDALVEALDSGHRSAWLRYVAWTALSFYAHFFTFFVVLAQILVVALRMRPVELRNHILSGVGVIVLCLPFLPFFLANSDGSQILHVRRSDLVSLYDLLRLFAGSTWWLFAASIALATLGVAVWGWRALQPFDRFRLSRVLVPLLWLLAPILAVFLISYVKPMFKERYLFAAMPAVPLLVAMGLAAVKPWYARAAVGVATVGLAVVPLTTGLEIRQNENWRGATQYLEESAQPDDGWIFISKRGQLGYEYYAGWLGGARPVSQRPDILEPFDWIELADSEGYYRALTSGTSRLPEFSARHGRIWLVLSHEFDSTFEGDTSEAVRNWLSRRGYAVRQRGFQNIRVLLYERRA